MVRRWIIATLCLLPLLLNAQEQEADAYYPYEHDEPYRPMIESDTSLFYRAIQLPRDLYDEVTRYSFLHIATARRGERFAERCWRLGGEELSYRNFSLLRSCGLKELSNEELSPFLDPEPSFHRLQLHFSGHRYLLGLRYRMGEVSPHNWQLGLYAEGRLGRDLYTQGIYTRTLRLALRAEREWSRGLRLSLLAALAPTEEGRASSTTQEAYDLIGSSYYNPAWGFWEGKARSSRIRREWLPLLSASLDSPIGKESRIALTLLAEGGTRRLGSLGWFDSATPQPDNYRQLPSYYEEGPQQEAVEARWRAHDARYTQIDWAELYAENRLSEEGARYVEQERVERLSRLGIGIEGESRVGRALTLHYGLQGSWKRSRNYLFLKDLLGADYLLDIDYYLIDDNTYRNSLENDLRNPQRRVKEGERFGYDYALQSRRLGAWGSIAWHTDRWHLDASLRVEEVKIHRRGFYEKELFPEDGSYGSSRAIHLAPWRAGMTLGYAFTPRHYLGLRGEAEGRDPEAENLFLQSQYNNRTIESPRLEEHYRAELFWRSNGRKVNWSATLFLHLKRHGIEVSHLYDDLSGLYTDRVSEGIGERYWGVEASAICYLSYRWRLHLAATAMEARYVENPLITLYSDRDNTLISHRAESYLGNCRPGGVPQLQGLVGISYFGGSWGIRLEATYAGGRYATPDLMRRTERALTAAGSQEGAAAMMSQEQLKDCFRGDLSAWKSFLLGEHRLTLSLSIDNLLGDDRTPYAAYEQGRIRRLYTADGYTYRPFDNRLSYSAPRTIYLSASFRF